MGGKTVMYSEIITSDAESLAPTFQRIVHSFTVLLWHIGE